MSTKMSDEKAYKKQIRAWTLYDWANSAFMTTIVAAVLPVYYSSVAGSTLPSAAKATQYWSATLSVSVFIVAILSPILGTVSDIMRGKKKFLSLFLMIGVVGTGLLYFVDTGDWLMASVFFIIGRIGFSASIVFYDSLLPHIAKEEDQDRVSTTGYALGYLGGGVLLIINIIMIETMQGTSGVRWSFITVALWWLVFSIPILRDVREPESTSDPLPPGQSLVKASFSQVANTIKNIRQYKDLFRYLVAFLIYNDAIGIIISVAAIYGAELGFGSLELILAILLVQFVGIPYSLVFGNLPSKGNARQTMYVAFVIFNIFALPLVAIGSKAFLAQTITGTPSPDFVTVGNAVGQGIHTTDAFAYTGVWETEQVTGEARGQTCAFYAVWCDETDFETSYAVSEGSDAGASAGANARVDLAYNGQKVRVTYQKGAGNGVWDVLIDGENVGEIDAESETVRYDVFGDFSAETEAQHTLSLIPQNDGKIALSTIEVLQPLRASNLGAIIGILAGLQLIGMLFSYLAGPRFFQGIADKIDTKRAIMLALCAYVVIAIWAFFLNSVIEFWFLAWMIATVQGGSQALSRSLYAVMTPTSKSGEFFGFFSIMSKFASFLSPLIFVLSVAIFDSSRPGVLCLLVFFFLGMYLLNGVDVDAGKRYAQEIERA